MIYIGVDIIEIDRISKAIEEWGDKFLTRVFTPTELANYRKNHESLAARFAAKEAIYKSLGKRDTGISWQEIEVLSESSGVPTVNLRGKALEVARSLEVKEIKVSLAHSGTCAVAFAVGEAG